MAFTTAEQYVGKRVEMQLVDADEPVTGTVENANPVGLVFRPLNSRKPELLQNDQVTSMTLATDKEPELKSKRANPVTITNVKRHLVDRHGYTLADINAMSPDDAFEFHEKIDHDPIGHHHAEKKDKAVEGQPTITETGEHVPEGVSEQPATETATVDAPDDEDDLVIDPEDDDEIPW